MPVLKDPRKIATDAAWAEYGRAVRAAKFAYDAAVRAALDKRNQELQDIAKRLSLPLEREAS